MGTRVKADACAQAQMDALDTYIGATGCLVLYDGVVGTDPGVIPSGSEVCVMNLPSPALGACTIEGTAPNETARVALQSTSNGTVTSAGTVQSYAIFNNQSTRTAANMVEKGDVSTIAAGTGALQISSTALALNETIDPDEANFYFEMDLNQTT